MDNVVNIPLNLSPVGSGLHALEDDLGVAVVDILHKVQNGVVRGDILA